jgi:hypothetical protein
MQAFFPYLHNSSFRAGEFGRDDESASVNCYDPNKSLHFPETAFDLLPPGAETHKSCRLFMRFPDFSFRDLF